MASRSLPDPCDLHDGSRHAPVRHGTHCDCVALAAALGLPAGAISFYYCRTMLQRRWSMTCKHGEVESASEPAIPYAKWKNKGDMNPVLAILVKNA
jgi:hypothetical protein